LLAAALEICRLLRGCVVVHVYFLIVRPLFWAGLVTRVCWA
jgi:hypothetical protein